jgi:tetratricopeptide (TPR) repeat protein
VERVVASASLPHLRAADVLASYLQLLDLRVWVLQETAHALRAAAKGTKTAEVAGVIAEMASVLLRHGHREQACDAYEEALGVFRRKGERGRAMEVLQALAPLHVRLGRLEEAAVSYRDLIQDYRQQNDPKLVDALIDAARVKRALGEGDEAGDLFTEAIGLLRDAAGGKTEDLGAALTGLGAVRTGQGRFEEAHALLDEALEVQHRVCGMDTPQAAVVVYERGCLFRAEGHLDEARVCLEEARGIWKAVGGESVGNLVDTLGELAEVWKELGEPTEARACLEEALQLCREGGAGLSGADTATCLGALGTLHKEQGQLEEARSCWTETLQLWTKIDKGGGVRVADASMRLAEILHALNQPSEAKPLFAEALQIYRQLGPVEVALDVTAAEQGLQECSRPPLSPSAFAWLGRSLGFWEEGKEQA